MKERVIEIDSGRCVGLVVQNEGDVRRHDGPLSRSSGNSSPVIQLWARLSGVIGSGGRVMGSGGWKGMRMRMG